MSSIKTEIRTGAYYDSVILMQLQRSLADLPKVIDAGVVMATEANKDILDQTGLLVAEIKEAKDILEDLKGNLEKITHHGKRADAIVKGMLQHSRTSTGEKVPTDINALCDEYIRLAYHGLRAKDNSFNADIEMDLYGSLQLVSVIPQDISRVILNIVTNAFQAVHKKSLETADNKYAPKVTCKTEPVNDQVIITISDNGLGIPNDIKDKIFQPFFTTKSTGQGTGLGLSLAYDIIKAHGGVLGVEGKLGEGSSFVINIPL